LLEKREVNKRLLFANMNRMENEEAERGSYGHPMGWSLGPTD